MLSAPTLSEPGAAEEEQVSNTQEIETLDRRSRLENMTYLYKISQ